MALALSSFNSLEKGFDQGSSLVMIQPHTGFSLGFPLTKIIIKELKDNPAKMKQLVLSNLVNVPDQVRSFVEITELYIDSFMLSPLRYRHPWGVLWGNISRGNACVAGDALHPMTPDIGQGGCSALEDGVVLARGINSNIMELVEEVVIVGAGIAGLATSLGLHRLGIRSLVLESSAGLRVTGFALSTWTNAWRALDAVGVGHSLRQQHGFLDGLVASSTVVSKPGKQISFKVKGTIGDHEVRCVRRKLLLEALEKELPDDTIRYSSKVVSIEESGYLKLVHLADDTIIKTKVLIGCDGVNSVVARFIGFKKPAFAGRSAIRGYADFKVNHGFGSKFLQLGGKGVRSGFLPCDDTTIYWFFTYFPTGQDKELEDNPTEMKQFVLSKLGNVAEHVRTSVELTELDSITSSPLRFRHPWEVLWGNISKGNVTVAGDALHPMTPDIGQGGCAALEDGVVLARCLAEALKKELNVEGKEREREEYKRVEMGLKKYAAERRWRSFELISTAYIVGAIQQSDGKIMNILRDTILAKFLAGLLLKKADFDCGKLNIS
ncbi:hypothetical protein NC652_012347 [Populus alba x Populus x berolinensis]|uniref:FAD-binding domain-containing protein n=1 Tax=Populus alba x Populus x berolinensis TaxID=444605 RepID=A0AAD6W7E4_9ROSI|nr:hypothetical protein NC652_012347 [Populus alba x Populus x berolinensis]KAJ7001506.1 hypothetical protein NC653_011808 [Populus alba x Populus x berolinensis]